MVFSRQTPFPSRMLPIHKVPAGVFISPTSFSHVRGRELSDLIEAVKSSKEDKLVIIEDKIEIVQDTAPQISLSLGKFFQSLKPNARLEDIFSNAADHLANGNGNGNGNVWASVMIVELRIETDWLTRLKDEKCPERYYISFSQIQERLSSFLEKNIKSDAVSRNLLSFDCTKELPMKVEEMVIGWPEGLSVLTTDAIIRKIEENSKQSLNSLERSILMSYIASKSKYFFGNIHSSLTRLAIHSREEVDEGGLSFAYNSQEVEQITSDRLRFLSVSDTSCGV